MVCFIVGLTDQWNQRLRTEDSGSCRKREITLKQLVQSAKKNAQEHCAEQSIVRTPFLMDENGGRIKLKVPPKKREKQTVVCRCFEHLMSHKNVINSH